MELAITDTIAATLRRSARRRSIGIRVHRGQVLVSAPVSAPLPEITHFLQLKRQWIEKHWQRQRLVLDARQEPEYAHGDEIRWLGQALSLDLVTPVESPERRGQQLFLGDAALLRRPDDLRERKRALAAWYISSAEAYLPPRIAQFEAAMGVKSKGFTLRYYKSRWGSCNRRGELQFNWLLMMAPATVIDYVIVHELAHLRHFNHSPAFWQCVARTQPDYVVQRQWLKDQTLLFW
jgi:predicted metal-dependent hydrolase